MINDISEDNKKNKTSSYAAYNRDTNIRVKSSSGGLFYSFAKKVIHEGGVVVGASFDKDGQVFHKVCTTLQEVESVMRSKYVQSDMNSCYKAVRAELLKQKTVLFCGTSCQVNGLLSYLEIVSNNDAFRKNLITVDFICHGVPSRMVWRRYLEEISLKRKLVSINFRDKTNGWRDFSLKIDYSDGTKYIQSWLKDPYVMGFIRNLYLRPSCYECKFKGIERASDFTIADFWHVHEIMPDFFDDLGTSILMVHNDRAMGILKSVENEFYMTKIENEIITTTNKSVSYSVADNPNRFKFYRFLKKHPQEKLKNVIASACKISLINRIKRKLLRVLNIKN